MKLEIRTHNSALSRMMTTLATGIGIDARSMLEALVQMNGAPPYDVDTWDWNPKEGWYEGVFEDESALLLAFEPGVGWICRHPEGSPQRWFLVFGESDDFRNRPDNFAGAMTLARLHYGRGSANKTLKHRGTPPR